MKYLSLVAVIFILTPFASACKDIIVMNDATAGDYNLFMKVRDPSRQGSQVLFMVNRGYEYSYHHPQKNFEVPYKIKHKLIGTATLEDVPPSIIKAGILLSDADIAYGDADTSTLWINPSKKAWDDFDWLRYSAQDASNEDEAVEKLEEVVKMHAPSVGENLFIVGKSKAYVVEADAFHFVKEEVKDIAVMSNYPKQLWHSRWLTRIPIASSFDRVYEGNVHRWQTVHIGGLYGINILKIGNEWIIVRQVPLGEKIKVEKGKGAKVGNFYVELEESNGKTARIKVCYEYNGWEKKITDMLREKYGKITVRDLMNISRIHSEELEGLRGFCEGEKKATMICKIPCSDGFSGGWFAPDQCSSIFVPFHICDRYIYEAYTNGNAAELSLNILIKFGHGGVNFTSVERVLLKENEKMEKIALKNKNKAEDILTSVDVEMQKQAFMMMKLYINLEGEERSELKKIWGKDYYETVCNIQRNINKFGEYGKEVIANIALSICKTRIDVESFVNGSSYYNEYSNAENLIKNGDYEEGVKTVKKIFEKTDESLFGITHEKKDNKEKIVFIGSAIIFIAVIITLLRKPKEK
ncbi:MAG TPA: hypothetical protein ENI53_00355 [Thermoplasmatales archaeon]|nr:hypothetical protein [Thermoplasmatales archaeon]